MIRNLVTISQGHNYYTSYNNGMVSRYFLYRRFTAVSFTEVIAPIEILYSLVLTQ